MVKLLLVQWLVSVCVHSWIIWSELMDMIFANHHNYTYVLEHCAGPRSWCVRVCLWEGCLHPCPLEPSHAHDMRPPQSAVKGLGLREEGREGGREGGMDGGRDGGREEMRKRGRSISIELFFKLPLLLSQYSPIPCWDGHICQAGQCTHVVNRRCW